MGGGWLDGFGYIFELDWVRPPERGATIFSFASLNFLAITLSAGVGYLLGSFWYSPMGFGRTWSRLKGNSMEEQQDSTRSMILAFLAIWLTSLALALVIQAFAAKTFLEGASVGLLVGVGLISTSMFSDTVFGNWNTQLFVIQAGYRICFVTLAGGILAFWR